MIQRFVLVIFVCIGLGIFFPARAQDSTFGSLPVGPGSLPVGPGSLPVGPDSLPALWDLKACLDYASKNNITINLARLSAQTGQQELLLSKAAKLPSLSGSTSQTFTNSKNTNPVVGGFQTQSSFASSYALSSGVTLYQGGYLNDVIRQNQLVLRSDNLSVLENIEDISVQITAAFLNILLAKENIVYEKDLVTTSAAQVKQARQEYDAGSIALVDLAELQAQLATDKYSLVTGQSTYRQSILNLKVLLELPSGTPFEVQEPDTLIATALVPSLDSVQQIAYQTRPEIKIGQLSVQSAGLDLAKARSGYYPTLRLSGGLSTGFSNNEGGGYIQQLDNNFFQQVGLSLSIPIFSNRVNRTNVENAKIEIQEDKLNLQGATIALSQTVEQAYINVINAQGQYDASVEQLKYTEESYRIATQELKVGAADVVQFLQQKNAYVQALQAYVQAKYNAVLDVKVYDFYSGVPMVL